VSPYLLRLESLSFGISNITRMGSKVSAALIVMTRVVLPLRTTAAQCDPIKCHVTVLRRCARMAAFNVDSRARTRISGRMGGCGCPASKEKAPAVHATLRGKKLRSLMRNTRAGVNIARMRTHATAERPPASRRGREVFHKRSPSSPAVEHHAGALHGVPADAEHGECCYRSTDDTVGRAFGRPPCRRHAGGRCDADDLIAKIRADLVTLGPIIDLEVTRSGKGSRAERGLTVGEWSSVPAFGLRRAGRGPPMGAPGTSACIALAALLAPAITNVACASARHGGVAGLIFDVLNPAHRQIIEATLICLEATSRTKPHSVVAMEYEAK
jgi:hypothetical protein